MILQYQKSQTDLFFRFWDIQLYMTETPTSSELETVAVKLTAILFNVKTTDCMKWKQMLVIKSSNWEQKLGYLLHPVYTIDF